MEGPLLKPYWFGSRRGLTGTEIFFKIGGWGLSRALKVENSLPICGPVDLVKLL